MGKKLIIKRAIIIAIPLLAIIALVLYSRASSAGKSQNSLAEAREGTFEISVSATGELNAEKSLDLKGPVLPSSGNRRRGRRNMRSMNLKIVDLVPEGTIVRKGDYVAQLDRTNYDNTLKDEEERLTNMQADYEMKKLDTAVTLTDLRNDIKNQAFTVEVAAINLEKSKYEPPATIREAELALDRESRNLKMKQKTYKLKLSQNIKDINNLKLDLTQEKRLIEDLKTYLEGFTITSPADGMVIYKRNWNGTKRKTGESINPFDMVVATLPDLSSMVSKIYISEIDISKVKVGQEVNIKVDAFPDKNFAGTVTSVARIGEQLPNSDTKMFEVLCRLDGSDPNLRPSMTTSNEIIIKSYDDVIFVPQECVQADAGEGYTYVLTKSKTKQIVVVGESNGKDIIVNAGLDPGTEVYLSPPDNSWKFRLAGENLITSAGPSPNKEKVKNISD
jgi:multidrug efflux pump subunit AcrA (membrane-fusion protein)